MKPLHSTLLALAVVALTGCSTFNRQWKAAVAWPAPADSIEGPWQGTWTSEATGHEGALRAVIAHKTNQVYLARFQAKYNFVVPLKFSYTLELEVEKKDGVFAFRGQEDLGAMAGGVYRYEGQAKDTNYYSSYKSDSDHGTFRMV